MNHFWSGGSSNPEWHYWTDPKGPSAAVASWNFFSRFTLSNTAWSCRPAAKAKAKAPHKRRKRHRRHEHHARKHRHKR